jgi:hypothetical protein
MLQEIAITPDVFHTDSYSSREECDSRLEGISDILLESFLIRNLRNGQWRNDLWREKNRSPHSGQKLLKQLWIKKRLRSFPNVLEESPETSEDWCREALATSDQEELSGILTSKATKHAFKSDHLIYPIERCRNSDWWQSASGGASPRIERNLAAFRKAFGLVFNHASQIIFMDPHLDPGRNDYQDTIHLIENCRNADLIEIHRVCYEGIGEKRIVSNEEWERRFNEKLAPIVTQHGIRKMEVFIWPDEHDRHIITNLMGFHLGNGLTTTTDPKAKMTCTRLSQRQSDEIQRELDPNVNTPIHRFVVD